MSKRLQVVVGEPELREIRKIARRKGMTVSEWVRSVIRAAAGAEPRGGVERKLQAIREAAKHEAPTGDIDQMLAEIERGYLA